MSNFINRTQETTYTKCDNHILMRHFDDNGKKIVDKEELKRVTISLKAIGLYVFMSSKPSGWDFSIERIALQLNDGIKSVGSGLKELREKGYVHYYKLTSGKSVYEILREPKVQKPNVVNPNKGKRPELVITQEVITQEANTQEEFHQIEKDFLKEIIIYKKT